MFNKNGAPTPGAGSHLRRRKPEGDSPSPTSPSGGKTWEQLRQKHPQLQPEAISQPPQIQEQVVYSSAQYEELWGQMRDKLLYGEGSLSKEDKGLLRSAHSSKASSPKPPVREVSPVKESDERESKTPSPPAGQEARDLEKVPLLSLRHWVPGRSGS